MADSVKLVCIPPDMIPKVWPMVREMVDRGYAEADELLPDDIEESLSNKKMLLWVALEGGHACAAMTTTLYRGRSGLHMYLVACGGDRLLVWKHLMAEIEKYARAEGCVKIRAQGRRGWLRTLHGFSIDRVIFEKRL